jgi:hypothetical protein
LINEHSFSFSTFIAHGCGRLRNKCKIWSRNLLLRGCNHIVLIHALDEHNLTQLQSMLTQEINEINHKNNLILIPVYEIEAWLLSDPLALKETFNMNRLPRVTLHPETIQHPKEHLRDIVWKSCKKRYVNTIHNKKIAESIRIERLSSCPSFSSYPKFIVPNLIPRP